MSDKEYIEFFLLLEERLENETDKIEEFKEILTGFQSEKYYNINKIIINSYQNDESSVLKIKKLLSENPLLLYEFNKFLPKNFKVQVVNENLAFDYVQKIKRRDEEVFAKFLKVTSQYKDGEISYNSMCLYIDRILLPYPDLLEEAYLYLNHKKINASYRKSLINRYRLLQKSEHSNKKTHNNNNNSETNEKPPTSPQKVENYNNSNNKSSNNPEMMFFENLKQLMDREKYNIFLKLLNLYCIVRIKSITSYNIIYRVY